MAQVSGKSFVKERPLGRPADFDDRIVAKRVDLVKKIDGFCDDKLTLVDVGCGNGASLFLLADKMKLCIGIDINPEYRNVFERAKLERNITNCVFKLMDIEKDKTDLQCDRLLCFEVIEHLKDEKSVKLIYDLLKKPGLAAISVPNRWWLFETHGAKLPLLPWNRVPFFSWLPRPIHERYANARTYTKKRITRLLQAVGFEVIQVNYITAPLDVMKNGKLKSILLKYIFRGNTTKIPFLATSIFVAARKG